MPEDTPAPQPDIIGDVVFGGAESPVAVCTLASRRLLPLLAGRPEIAIAGRVFTENVGIERMIQNLVAVPTLRYLIVCGRESPHKVGQTILALHRSGLDDAARVIGSEAPEPFMPNLTDAQLQAFHRRVTVVDMIGTEDAEQIVARAEAMVREAQKTSDLTDTLPVTSQDSGEAIVAAPDPQSSWQYYPVGFFLIFVDRERRRLRAEQYSQERRFLWAFDGRDAQELCHTILRHDQVTLLAHAAYLGRELAKAEAALGLGLDYEQDSPLRADRPWPRLAP
jgi:tetrahydromethanopterin S-methyltransferase subunit A